MRESIAGHSTADQLEDYRKRARTDGAVAAKKGDVKAPSPRRPRRSRPSTRCPTSRTP